MRATAYAIVPTAKAVKLAEYPTGEDAFLLARGPDRVILGEEGEGSSANAPEPVHASEG